MAAKTKGSAGKKKASKSRERDAENDRRKTNPDHAEVGEPQAEPDGAVDEPRTARSGRDSGKGSRRGTTKAVGSDEGREGAPPDDRGAAQIKAGGGGLLTRVAAVGEYGAALTEYGREGLTKAGTAIRQGATAVTRATADGVTRGRDTVARGWDAYPLAFCGAALAAGVVAGLLLPSTKVEDSLMGQAADRVNGRLRKVTDELAEKSKNVAGKAVEQAKAVAAAAAGDEGLTPQALGQRVKRVAGRVKQAVADAVEVA